MLPRSSLPSITCSRTEPSIKTSAPTTLIQAPRSDRKTASSSAWQTLVTPLNSRPFPTSVASAERVVSPYCGSVRRWASLGGQRERRPPPVRRVLVGVRYALTWLACIATATTRNASVTIANQWRSSNLRSHGWEYAAGLMNSDAWTAQRVLFSAKGRK